MLVALVGYAVFLGLTAVACKRWHQRMVAYDAATGDSSEIA